MNYPFVKCVRPVRIHNPYTNQDLVAPCGKCPVCLMVKNSRYALQCELESLSHKYCYFITLTYDNRSLPKCSVYLDTDFQAPPSAPPMTDRFHFVDEDTGEILHTMDTTVVEMNLLRGKFNLDGQIPYLRKNDLQKFFKRLRKRLSGFHSEKVRYFACGEYGPVHFRPHYHILLWFDEKRTADFLFYNVRKAWTHGRIDCQPVTSSASQYVAGYVSSSSLIPQVYQAGAFRPFCVHSTRLGQEILGRERDKIYELSFPEFVNRSAQIGNKSVSFRVWVSYFAYYFPKCRSFTGKSVTELYWIYTIYERACRTFLSPVASPESALDVAKSVYEYFKGVNLGYLSPVANDYDEHTVDILSQFFDPDYWRRLQTEKNVLQSIYTLLLVSRHFLDFCCSGIKDYNYRIQIIRKIKDFYTYLDYTRLTDWYRNQQEWFESDLLSDDDWPFFYDNVDTDKRLSECRVFKEFVASYKKMFVNKIKHKKLNDANDIFLSQEVLEWKNSDKLPF